MTYSDWREELSEAKARIVIKGLKSLGNVIRKVRKTKKPSIFIKSADGTKIQNPNVKPFTPEPSGQLPLINLKNPNLKGTNPVAKTKKPLKYSRAIYKQNKRKKLEELEKTARGLINQQNKLKKQALDGMQVNLLKKSDYPKNLQKYLGDDFGRITKIQEDMSKLPGLAGGGGGTNSITDAAPGKSIKKRVKDVGKILTFPLHKRRKDPTEKFATEGVAALAKKGGSKVIPALMTSIGAAGTIMQSKKDKKEPSDSAAKRLENIRNNKLYKKSKNPKDPSYLEKVLRNLRKEEVMAAPTNSVGDGSNVALPPTHEPGIKTKKNKRGSGMKNRKKKTYAYGGYGSRKNWMV